MRSGHVPGNGRVPSFVPVGEVSGVKMIEEEKKREEYEKGE